MVETNGREMLESRCEVGIGEPESKYNRSLTRDAIRAFVSKDISSFYRSVLYIVELLMYLDKVEGRYNGNYRFFFLSSFVVSSSKLILSDLVPFSVFTITDT